MADFAALLTGCVAETLPLLAAAVLVAPVSLVAATYLLAAVVLTTLTAVLAAAPFAAARLVVPACGLATAALLPTLFVTGLAARAGALAEEARAGVAPARRAAAALPALADLVVTSRAADAAAPRRDVVRTAAFVPLDAADGLLRATVAPVEAWRDFRRSDFTDAPLGDTALVLAGLPLDPELFSGAAFVEALLTLFPATLFPVTFLDATFLDATFLDAMSRRTP